MVQFANSARIIETMRSKIKTSSDSIAPCSSECLIRHNLAGFKIEDEFSRCLGFKTETNAMKVKDLMTADVKCCMDHNTLNIVAQMMWDHDIGCVPVVDEEGCVIGMVTDRDICMCGSMEGVPLAWLWVTIAMSKEVFSCGADDDLAMAEKLMREKQVHRLPVLDADKYPIGIISLSDIACEGAREAKTKKARSISDTEIAQLVAAICAPYRVVEEQVAAAPSPRAS